ncbi:excalibur calcium-binding domain-containing protein [Actinokineospora terrae]|uniref:Excalibur calcium-binding domain-containing protein n=1 Tax=Actinokineospora terrae TaxID=155974 RepID=A0A1H9X396_9PSEU|nr:excalibur calcium-binding domain-containing protein [Actinokineospora terrae]SES40501.1 Excalibur calcium-binding domain-containing protein [Actinokineospora terrae]
MLVWWRNRKRKWLWITGALLLALFVVAGLTGDPNRAKQQAAAAPPGPSAPAPTSTSAPDSIAVPADLVGKNAAEAKTILTDLGFTTLVYESVDGRNVLVPENWTVVAVEGATTAVARTTKLVLRVDKPREITTVPSPTTEVAVPTVAVAPPVTEPEVAAPADAYYKNCDEARAAGAAPIHRGEPGYRTALDRNKDGVACE